MNLSVADGYDEMSLIGARIVKSVIEDNPKARLGLTTGRTPLGMYRLLSQWTADSLLDLSGVTIFTTEEYLGVGTRDKRSLYQWLKRAFLDPCRIRSAQIVRLQSESREPQLACQYFEDRMRSVGGLDIVVEGIGTNAHVGFNEPGSPACAGTRITGILTETRRYNFHYWRKEVPKYGMTIGLSGILAAKIVLLLASGKIKAEALRRAFCGPVTDEVPASHLQSVSNLEVVADREAASLLCSSGKEDSR